MNVFNKVKQYNRAVATLGNLGYNGDLDEALPAVLSDLEAALSELFGKNKESTNCVEQKAGARQDTYFISYAFSGSEFHNGGKTVSGTGMAMLTVAGGITDWQSLKGVTDFIRNNHFKHLPNATVTVTNFQPMPAKQKNQHD